MTKQKERIFGVDVKAYSVESTRMEPYSISSRVFGVNDEYSNNLVNRSFIRAIRNYNPIERQIVFKPSSGTVMIDTKYDEEYIHSSLVNTTLQSIEGVNVTIENLSLILNNFSKEIVKRTKELEPEFKKIIDDKFWEMI